MALKHQSPPIIVAAIYMPMIRANTHIEALFKKYIQTTAYRSIYKFYFILKYKIMIAI